VFRPTLISTGYSFLLICSLFFINLFAETKPLVISSSDSSSIIFSNFCDNGECNANIYELKTFLDSTGFFLATINVIDTIFLTPNSRTIIREVIYSGDTLKIEPLPYSASAVSNIINQKVLELADKGYPFAKISPKFSGDTRETILKLIEEKGFFAINTNLKFISDKKISPWLLSRSSLFDDGEKFNYSQILASVKKIETQPYIFSAKMGGPAIAENNGDTTLIVPVFVSPQKSLFIDGALSWASEPDNRLTGNISLSLVNLLTIGEEFNFLYFGDSEFQQTEVDIFIPYFLKLPISLFGSFNMELSQNNYALFGATAGIAYDVWKIWRAGLGVDYYELDEQEPPKNRRYTGAILTLKKLYTQYERGQLEWRCDLSAGTGIRQEESNSYALGEGEATLALQVPIKRFALYSQLFVGAKAINSNDTLHATEKFRIGGSQSVRGYLEREFPFIAATYLKNEIRYYFSKRGALYIFGDPATGIKNSYDISDSKTLFGYGAGIHIPVRKFNFTLEWAKNIDKPSGFGVLHFSIGN
jgi:outer membrane protein assembly factor BamA